ncbi:MAG: Imm1 family immunity protein [Dermatophilaceae bacterium]
MGCRFQREPSSRSRPRPRRAGDPLPQRCRPHHRQHLPWDGRFDVGGNATGDVLVYQSDDKRHFHWATTPGAASDSETQVTIAGIPGRFSRRQVVTVDAALAAARTFVATGQRDSALTWLDDTTSLVVRPPGLDEP